MLDIGTIISLVSAVPGFFEMGQGIYETVSGMKKGSDAQQMIAEIGKLNGNLERLTDHILYAPTVQMVRDINQNQQRVLTDLREVRQYLEPVQQVLDDDQWENLYTAYRRAAQGTTTD